MNNQKIDKRNLSFEDKIIFLLDENIKNLEPNFRKELYDYLYSHNCNNIVKMKKMVTMKYSFKCVNSHNLLYWTQRGWETYVAKIKARELSSKRKANSPYSLSHWTSKINPLTNKNYTIEEAEFEKNSRRPIRKEYWMVRGFSEENATMKAKEAKNNNNRLGNYNATSKMPDQYAYCSHRCKEYWMVRGFSEENAITKVSEVQSTFSLNKCIEKHGEEDGRKIWQKRQDKWQETLNSKSDDEKARINSLKCSKGYTISNAEKELIKTLSEIFDNVESSYSIFYNNGLKYYVYDIRLDNKIIEYNGDFYHANPNLYDESFMNPKTKKSAREIWAKEAHKEKIANDNGFSILRIWENEYKSNKQECVNRCVEFLTQ